MVILAMLVLLESFAVPGIAADGSLVAPWERLGDGSISLYSAVFFGLFLVAAALPMPYVLRSGLFAGVGGALLTVGLVAIRTVEAGFGFRGQPGLHAVFSEPALLALVLSTLLFPAALYWRSRYTASWASRIGVLVGILSMMLAYLLSAAVLDGGAPPILELSRRLMNADSLLANRISIGLLLVPAGLILPSLMAFLKAPRTGLGGLWAFCFCTALAAIPLVQAGFVASVRQGHWRYVLAPLQAGLFLYAGLLIAPLGLGHFVGALTHRLSRPRESGPAGGVRQKGPIQTA